MDLGLEVIGEITELTDGEEAPAQPPVPPLQRLRDSHHAVARLVAAGLNDQEVSLATGYAPMRVFNMRTHDPLFRDLVAHYRQNKEAAAVALEAKLRMIAEDYAQHIHETLLDKPDEVGLAQAVETFKVFADRAGYAPVQHTRNVNVNVGIGARLDEARRRKAEIDHE